MRTLEVEVSGPGSGRESALRALQAGGLHDHLDPRRDADPAQWLPAAQASARLSFRIAADARARRRRLPHMAGGVARTQRRATRMR